MSFTFTALPRLAQISPVMDIAVTDVDGDGKLDLILAQNFYHPQRETGRMDGGVSLLLLNQGQRAFAPVWPHHSGIALQLDPGASRPMTSMETIRRI